MSSPGNPNPSSSDPYYGRSERDRIALDALLMLGKVSACAPGSAMGNDAPGPSGNGDGGKDDDKDGDEDYQDQGDGGDGGDEDSSSSDDDYNGDNTICSKCGKSKTNRGRYCPSCHSKRRGEKAKKAGKCRDCPKRALKGYARCRGCLGKQRIGKCTYCKRRPPAEGLSVCLPCKPKVDESREKQREARRKEREDRGKKKR